MYYGYSGAYRRADRAKVQPRKQMCLDSSPRCEGRREVGSGGKEVIKIGAQGCSGIGSVGGSTYLP